MLKEYMLKKYLKDVTNKSAMLYYGFALRQNNDKYYFSMVGHHTYDFWLGEGRTIEDAVKNVKVVTNCYNYEDYQSLAKSLKSYDQVEFVYKPEEIMEMKAYSMFSDHSVESLYTFCDEAEAHDFFERSSHYKILQKIEERWVDVTNEFKCR